MGFLTPNFWLEEHIERHPAAAGTLIRRLSNKALGDATYKEGRIQSISTVERSLSDMQGNWVRGRISWEEADTDHANRALLADPETDALLNREVIAYVQSEEGRWSGGTPYTAGRFLIQQPTFGDRMTAGRTAADWLGSRLSPFNVDRKILENRRFTRGMFPQLPKELVDKVIPAILGEANDSHLKTATGESAAKGKARGYRVGEAVIKDLGIDPVVKIVGTSDYEFAYVSPPSLAGLVTGTAGNRTISYAVAARTVSGQTLLSNTVTITTAPEVLSNTNYIVLTITPPATYADKVVGYVVYVQDGGGTPSNRLVVVTSTTVEDKGTIPHNSGIAPQDENTAKVILTLEGETVLDAEIWGMYVMCCHAVNPDHINQLYGPLWGGYNVNTGQYEPSVEPYRGLYWNRDPETFPFGSPFGVDILIPGQAQFPLSTPYMDVIDQDTGITHRLTVMFARGPRDFYAAQMKAGFAWNTCGLEDEGDGTGEPIRKAAFMYQHVLSEFVAANNGDGYFSGLWNGLPYFVGGSVAMIDAASIQAFQTYTIGRVGGIGYTFDYIMDREWTVGEFISTFNTCYETRCGTNMYGQLKLAWIDEDVDVSTANVYRHIIEIEKLGEPEIDYSALENRTRFVYQYDNDTEKFLAEPELIENEDSKNKYKEWYPSDLLELWFISDEVTARDAMGRRSLHRAYHLVHQTYTTRLIHFRDDIGAVVNLTHPMGLGATGYSEVPFQVERISLNMMLGQFTVRALRLTGGGTDLIGQLESIVGNPDDADGWVIGNDTPVG